MSDIENILSFTKFLNKFRDVERSIYKSDNPRKENDAEHSRQLAMLSRYIISTQKLPLSLEKVLQYCLVHDIVEMYAGDMEALNRSPEQQAQKEQNEAQALERIRKEFPEGSELRDRLEEYEHRNDEESKFVYAVDKLLPPLNIYNDNGYRWKHRGIDLDTELRPVKQGKIHISPEVGKLRDQLYELMKTNESSLFTPTK